MTTTTFGAQVRGQPGLAIIDLAGEINAFAETSLNIAYSQAELDDPSVIVLNFNQVHYINSTGIALIVGLLAQARKTHRKLAVYGLSNHYSELFQITRLADFMDIYTDEASVIQSKR